MMGVRGTKSENENAASWNELLAVESLHSPWLRLFTERSVRNSASAARKDSRSCTVSACGQHVACIATDFLQ